MSDVSAVRHVCRFVEGRVLYLVMRLSNYGMPAPVGQGGELTKISITPANGTSPVIKLLAVGWG